jgi:hypothetical protein
MCGNRDLIPYFFFISRLIRRPSAAAQGRQRLDFTLPCEIERELMRFQKCLVTTTLCAFLMMLSFGCGDGSDVKVANAPPDAKPTGPTELKGEGKRAVGPGTSAQSGKNPGASN